MENSSAKHFALQLGSLISLYLSLGALTQLLFGIITIQYPDQLNGYWEFTNASSSMRISIAMLVVFFPTYLALTRVTNVGRRVGVAYTALTKWLIYLSLLVGGAVLLGDLVAVIYNFLNGELTVRFVLKALALLAVVGSACTYYVYDARDYWQTHEKTSVQCGIVVTVLVLIAIVFGYLNIETPAEVRERNADLVQITDLGSIQSYVVQYYTINSKLPETLADISNVSGLPQAPEGRSEYTYARNSASTFEICADFAYPSLPGDYAYTTYDSGMTLKNPDDWTHKAGLWCFTRVVSVPSVPQVKN
jgi:hypothetical protein